MARWQITVSGKGIRKETVEKIAQAIVDKYGKDKDGDDKACVSVRDATPPSSRSDRFQEALGHVGEAKAEFESLRDELQEWYDNLPENFQNGEKGEQLTAATEALEEAIDALDNVEGTEVEFPTMY